MNDYQNILKKIEEFKCRPVCCFGPTGPRGLPGLIGPTARCNKSSIYIFKW